MSMLEMKQVSYHYKHEIALEQIDLKVCEGDFLAIFGADDAGKTTLLKLLMGFVKPKDGEVMIDGENPKDLLQWNGKKMRFIPDDIIWEYNYSAKDYLDFIAQHTDSYDKEYEEELVELFDVNISVKLLEMTYRDNKVIQIISILAGRPEIILLDEPINFLDMQSYRLLLNELRGLKLLGTTIILAVELFDQAADYCNMYLYLKDGKIKQSGQVPVPDYRWKVLTVEGGEQALYEKYMDQLVTSRNKRKYWLYKGESELLYRVIASAKPKNFTVEALTFEEEIEGDFSRWE